jgi:hypothetical protein
MAVKTTKELTDDDLLRAFDALNLDDPLIPLRRDLQSISLILL